MKLLRISGFHRILLPLLALAWAGSAPAEPEGARRIGAASRPWPLPISVSLSSSFGEYRDGHIHAGIDLRTNGQDGIACAAVGDGAITRMRAASGGYGKALYLKLETGETVVYAHLSEFSPALEQYLWDAQTERGAYTVDLSIPASRFPVHEGEIIAYSGSTGTRAPHLHFEVRDIRENPVNPLSRGWKLIDDRAPEPKRVLWIPATAHSLVDGSVLPREVAVVRTASGFAARDTVTIAGSAGIGIYAIDRSDEFSGKLAPAKIELAVDGTLRARIERERFSYAQTGEVSLEYEMERVRTRNEHFLLLFERNGETLGGRTFVGGGLISSDSLAAAGAAPGRDVHSARIDLYDKNGNAAQVTIPFRIAERTGATFRRRANAGHSLFGFGDFLCSESGFAIGGSNGRAGDGAAAETVGAIPAELLGRGVVTFDAVQGRPVTLLVREHSGDPAVYCLPVSAGEAGRYPVPELGVSLRPRGNTLFQNGFMLLSRDAAGSLLPPEEQGLQQLSEPVFFGPWSLVIRSRVDIDFALAAQATGSEAVYKWSAASKRWFAAPSHAEGDTVSASVREPGIYCVCRDTVPPVVGRPLLTRHRMYATGAVYPEVVAAITDAGSGIDAAATGLFLDGRKVIGRWDPFRKKMFILLREENIIGDHTVTVVAQDFSGNETRVHAIINFPATLHPDSLNGSN